MIQVEKIQEVRFFSNSHTIMDLEALKSTIEKQLGFEVGLCYKAIYRGKKREGNKLAAIVRAIHVELSTNRFNYKFNKLVETYGRSKNGFLDSRRMRFWAHQDLVKSNKARGTLTIAYE